MKSVLAPLILFAMVAGGCGIRNDHPVPRRHSYPRIELYPESFIEKKCGDLLFDINSSAVVTLDSVSETGARWLTLSYPAYRCEVYLTVSSIGKKSLSDVYRNRLDRIVRDTPYGTPTPLPVATPGFSSLLFYTPESILPLHFLSTDSVSVMLSGSVIFPALPAGFSLDSVKPAMEAVKADMIALLESIKKK